MNWKGTLSAKRTACISSLKSLGAGSKQMMNLVVQTNEDTQKDDYMFTTVPLAYRSPPPSSLKNLKVKSN